MINLFSLIRQTIMENYTPTYGEIISENKDNTFNNAIKNICTDEEYNQYNELMNSDRQRLLNECQSTQYSQNIKKHNQSVTIPGIGEVTQVC